jgi:hypothetical protein
VVLIERRDEKFADPPHRCAEGGEIEEVKARRAPSYSYGYDYPSDGYSSYPSYGYSSYGYAPAYYGGYGGYGYASPYYGRGFYAYSGPVHRHLAYRHHRTSYNPARQYQARRHPAHRDPTRSGDL